MTDWAHEREGWLLQASPDELQAFLERAWAGREDAPPAADVNQWLWLYEGLYARFAYDPPNGPALPREEQLAWASIAVRIHEWLASQHAADWYRRHDFEHSAMAVRVMMIRRLGPEPGHPVIDAQRVVRWFRERAFVTPGFASAWSQRLRAEMASLPPTTGDEDGSAELAEWREGMLAVRSLKQRAALVAALVDCGAVTPDPELAAWLEARSSIG